MITTPRLTGDAFLFLLVAVCLAIAPGVGVLVLIVLLAFRQRGLGRNARYEERRKQTWGF